jgi:chromosome segregation ATPase
MSCLLAATPFAFSMPAWSQEEGLTFEQAQTRTAYARKQMEAKRHQLSDAEKREELALRAQDEIRKRYEEAQREAESATKAREAAEQDYAEAQRRWADESARLKQIHERR